MAAAFLTALLHEAPARLAPLQDKLELLGVSTPLVAVELLGEDFHGTIGEILEITDGLNEEETAYVETFMMDLRKVAVRARRVRDSETYLDDVLYCAKKAKLEITVDPVAARPAPPPGCWRSPKFGGRREVSAAAGDQRAMDRWVPRLASLLVRAAAPAVRDVEDVPAKVRIVCGKTRPGTLRLRVRAWEEFSRWLFADRLKVWPAEPMDVVDYLQMLVKESAAKSVVSHFAATCHWMLPRAGFGDTHRIMNDEFVKQAFGWAELQLDDAKVAIRKAPRLTVGVIIAMEVYVCSDGAPRALRVAAWLRLVKVYGALRWDDFRRIIPADVELRESGLVGRLTRTKTTGVGKKVRELPLFIPADASVAENDWLSTGYRLLQDIGPSGRDFMLPRPTDDLDRFGNRMASDTDAAILCRLMLADLKIPIKKADVETGITKWEITDAPFMSPLVTSGWTNHSERATLTSMLAAMGIDKARRDALGRWSPSGSDDYVRTYKSIVKDLLGRFCRTVASGRAYQLFDEEDAVADVTKRIKALGKASEEDIDNAMATFDLTTKEVAKECAAQAPEYAPTEVASLPLLSEELGDLDEADEAKYVVVYTRGRKEARLHLTGGCWRARRMEFRDFELIDTDEPPPEAYNKVCKDCWPVTPIQPSAAESESDDDESSSGESDSMS